jgi:amino acid adenylation domain-containing protein/non-ribosomal peptide synthase protein (TIGR01720 family)
MNQVQESYSLSPLQQGMLFHALYAPQTGVDIEQLVLTIDAPIDADALLRAWQALADRHALLRTRFRWEGLETPVQEALDRALVPVTRADWRALSLAQQTLCLDAFLADDRTRGFALDEAPLMRVALFDTADGAIVVWTFHHAVLDGRCFAPLLRELFARADGETPPLPPPPPFRAFIDWLAQRDPNASEAFWRDRLRGFRAPTPLVVDRLDDTADTPCHTAQTAFLAAPDTDRLKSLAQTHGLTLNSIVQGAWALLLHRYSGDDDIVFGTTRACRYGTVERADETIGPFINTLPLRIAVDPERSLIPWLKDVRAQHVALRPHEHTPLSLVQGWSEVPRKTPLFESLLVFENFDLDTALQAEDPAWKHRRITLHEQTNFPLTLAVYASSILRLKLDYDRQRFGDGTIQRLLGHLTTLLRAMAEDPDRTIAELPLVGAAEATQLPQTRSPAAHAFPGDDCLHTRFERQATRTPDAVALRFEETHLTYAELNARANRLAHRLRRHGVGPEVLVGLLAERSLDLVVGLLAILKAGGAYLPIDVVYPADRAAFMLDDARAPVLLTQRTLAERLPTTAATVLYLDDDLADEPTTNPEIEVTADHLAYVIFTSGSTGKPKGALVTHRNVVRLFDATDDWFHFDAADVWTLFHSHAFDFSVWEIWGALLTGGRLVAVPYLVSRDPEAFHALLRRERVTVLNQTPSAFRQLIQADLAGPKADDLALRLVIFGGEALELASLKPWFERYGDARPQLVNMYGITETTVHVTYRPLTRADSEAGQGSVIGVPIPDLQLHILDPQGRPTPIGVPGEIYVGGAGLARGYLDRPELTAQRFVADPFSPEPGARLYRTGDLARRLPGGDIEYRGRIDHQVKIRGFRIELGEIETALARIDGVRAAVVLVREDVPNEKRLVAYIVADDPTAPPPIAGLREALQARLPVYMLPSAFVGMDALPLTNNGKIDTKALPAPAAPPPSPEAAAAPRTPAEATLKTIWEDVLHQNGIGIHESFFERGGDSILSIHILARARQAGLQLTARQIFENPTIAALAAVATIDAASDVPETPVTLPDGDLPLTPIQRWFFEQRPPEPHYYNQAFCLTLRKPVSDAVLARALSAVVAHHDALRLRFTRSADGGWQQRYGAPEATVRIERIEHATVADAERVQASLNLADGPLLRAARLLAADGGADVLLLAIHHLAVDGVSWRFLLEDLDTACAQLEAGTTEVRLPARTLPFGRWAQALPARARSEAVQAEIPYWRTIAGAPSRSLPPPRSQTPPREGSAQTATVTLTDDETRALLTLLPATLRARGHEALLAALARALAPWLGDGTLRIALEGHGREDIVPGADLSRTVGWFTALYPALIDLDASADPARTLRTVKERLRAIPQNGVGYGLLHAFERDAVPTPSVELVFNFLGQLDRTTDTVERFAFSRTPTGAWHGPENPRAHRLEVLAMVQHGRLETHFTFSATHDDPTTIAALADRYAEALRALLRAAQDAAPAALAPSDFPLARLTATSLDALSARYNDLEDIYPLAPMQRLFHSVDASSPELGFEQWVFHLDGPLDLEALRTAWHRTIARHAVLRSAFVSDGLDEPLQVVRRAAEPEWRVEDGRQWTQDDWARFLADDLGRGFDLTQAPLLRLHLVHIGARAHRLVWATHHLLIDGWSWPLVLRDVARFYTAAVSGEPATLPTPTAYKEFVAWQAAHSGESETYWRAALAGFTRPTPIPGGHAPTRASGVHERAAILTPDTVERLTALARREGLTAGTLIQGAWALLLAHHTEERDVVFGASFSGRPDRLPGALEMVGPFVNNLPVRVPVPDDAAPLVWLKALQQAHVERSQHQDASPLELQRWTDIPLRRRLFESLVVVQNVQGGAQNLRLGDSVAVTLLESPDRTNFPLTLVATPGDALHLKLAGHASHLEAAVLETLLADLTALLEALATGAAQDLASLRARLSSPLPRAADEPTAPRLAVDLPTTGRERVIAGVWQEALGLETVGLDDNFFELGAHSLLLVTVHARLKTALRVDLPLVRLFQHPTIRSLARHLGQDADDSTFAIAARERAQRQREALAGQRLRRR